MPDQRLIIYQVFPRILTNTNTACIPWGTLGQNGSGKFADFTPEVLGKIAELGVNAIWYTGVLEMATMSDFSVFGIEPDNQHVVKGQAGSPYAIKDYYDVDPALAVDVARRLEEFDALVERTHKAGMKVLIDFVPNHTARQYRSDKAPAGVEPFGASDDTTVRFSPANDYYYVTNQQFAPQVDISSPPAYVEFPAKVTGNDCFTAFPSANDWYETVKLNYGRDYESGQTHFYPIPKLWEKMVHILSYWLARGVDGFRCDMVHMVPLEFWHWALHTVRKEYREAIFIGEIYDIGQYRPYLQHGGFDYLYDKVGLYDTIVGIERHGYSTARLTGCWQSLEGISDRMLNFLENHDEVRYGSPAFGGNPLNVTPALVVSAMFSSGPYMIYYGQEVGECGQEAEGFSGLNDRTTIFDYWSYESMRRLLGGSLTSQQHWLRELYRRVLSMCNTQPALRGNFFDLMYVNLSRPGFNPHTQFAFMRAAETQTLLIVANFADIPSECSVHIPAAAVDMMHPAVGKGLRARDLLSGRPVTLDLSPDSDTLLELPAKSALVLELPQPSALSDAVGTHPGASEKANPTERTSKKLP